MYMLGFSTDSSTFSKHSQMFLNLGEILLSVIYSQKEKGLLKSLPLSNGGLVASSCTLACFTITTFEQLEY